MILIAVMHLSIWKPIPHYVAFILDKNNIYYTKRCYHSDIKTRKKLLILKKLQKINLWSNLVYNLSIYIYIYIYVKSFIYYNVNLEYITIKVSTPLYTKQIHQERKIEKKLPSHWSGSKIRC